VRTVRTLLAQLTMTADAGHKSCKDCLYITTHCQTPIFCIVSRVDKRYL